MYIDWKEAKDREVFKLAKATKFKELRKIHFEWIKEEENKEVLDYLVSNCPDKLRLFAFDAKTFPDFGNGDFYLKGIEKVSVWVFFVELRLNVHSSESFLIKNNFK